MQQRSPGPGIISLILRHIFSPPNNSRLGHLCGPTDAHLRSIEAALGVRIAHRHEQFKVDGSKAAAQRAMEMLQALYEMAAKPIPEEVVQLMLAGDGTPEAGDGPSLSTRRADLKPRSVNQALYLDNIAQYDITIGIGPAGTGKTYLAVAAAVDALHRSAVQRIVLTRPAVEAGERLLLELKGKLGADIGMPSGVGHEAQSDILQALLALGYNDKEAALALKALPADVGVSEGIKLALKALAR